MKVEPVELPTRAKSVQPSPVQRSIRQIVTPTLSLTGSQLNSTWESESVVVTTFCGGVGGSVSGSEGPEPATRNATICISQSPPEVDADALYESRLVTNRSSRIDPPGEFITRDSKSGSGAVV